MDKPRLLSGAEIVSRGITKIDATLPEIGLKDVVPNGSWLELKQIQSALEARKQIIEVQRIEKSGVLSRAEWREELMLAEVTRMAGGHWQYLGHNVGRNLFLKPEEALFLMEVNCLQLTYNDVTVSLQQAYSLLLRTSISLLQYKVYASLSRIGYKVYRHENKKIIECEKELSQTEKPKEKVCETVSLEAGNEEEKDEGNRSIAMEEGSKGNNTFNGSNEIDKIEKLSECPKIIMDTNNASEYLEGKNDTVIDDSAKMETDTDLREDACNRVEDSKQTRSQSPKSGDSKNDKPAEETNGSSKLDVNEDAAENLDMNIDAGCDNTNKNECLDVDKNKIDKTSEDCTCKTETEALKDNKIKESVCNTEHISHVQNNMEISINEDVSEIKIDSTTNNEDIMNEKMNSDETMKEISHTSVLEKYCLIQNSKPPEQNNTQPECLLQYKIKTLENRKIRPLDMKNAEKYFERVPDVFQKQIVTVHVPEEIFIPRNVYLNNISYVLNLDNIRNKTKRTRTQSAESRPYSTNEEVNGDHIKRIKGAAGSHTPVNNPPPFQTTLNNRFDRPNVQSFWRPTMTFFPFNFVFQRHFTPNTFIPRVRVFSPRPSLLGMYPRFISFQPNEQGMPNQNNKRRNSIKQKETHLEAIKNLAVRLRQLVLSGNTQRENIDSLQRLINTFNLKYNTRLWLTDSFEVINDETILETISLDEDDEPSRKKPKTQDSDDHKDNLKRLKQLAIKLKGLEAKGEVTSRHRRALSSLIKKFNKSYNSDVYLNSKYEIIDRRLVNLDSSSDSDCVIEESEKNMACKKLKNPFNILKRLSEKINSNTNTNRGETKADDESKNGTYSAATTETFNKNWLPAENDFGRAEVVPNKFMNSYIIHSKREQFLFDFLKSQPYEFENWLDIKLSFLKNIEDTNAMIENDMTETVTNNSLLGLDDCTDMPSVLKKISIISTNKEIDIQSSLGVDFDVYNRDVQNFKKTNRPKPHFRIVCISESSSFPSGKDVHSLHAKYDDNITIVFAVVGVGSVSYLQINPIDLPVYIPTNDLS